MFVAVQAKAGDSPVAGPHTEGEEVLTTWWRGTNTVAQRGLQLIFCFWDLMVSWDSLGQK